MRALRLVLHQLESTNSIEAAKPVKTTNAETASKPQLLGIHYYFVRGWQERSVKNVSTYGSDTNNIKASTTCVSGWVNHSRAGRSSPCPSTSKRLLFP